MITHFLWWKIQWSSTIGPTLEDLCYCRQYCNWSVILLVTVVTRFKDEKNVTTLSTSQENTRATSKAEKSTATWNGSEGSTVLQHTQGVVIRPSPLVLVKQRKPWLYVSARYNTFWNGIVPSNSGIKTLLHHWTKKKNSQQKRHTRQVHQQLVGTNIQNILGGIVELLLRLLKTRRISYWMELLFSIFLV